MTARKRFLLRNEQQQNVATVITFFDEYLKHEIGFITTIDYKIHTSKIYEDHFDADIIADLAALVNISYLDYIELPIKK